MNSEERFKKSLEDLVRSKEFPFDEANWEKASELIAASKTTKRKFIPLLLAGLLLLISGLAGFYTWTVRDSSAPRTLVVKPAFKAPANRTITQVSKVVAPLPESNKPVHRSKPNRANNSPGISRPSSHHVNTVAPNPPAAETPSVKEETAATPVLPDPLIPVSSAPETMPLNIPVKEEIKPALTEPVAEITETIPSIAASTVSAESNPVNGSGDQNTAASVITEGEHLASDEPVQVQPLNEQQAVVKEEAPADDHTAASSGAVTVATGSNVPEREKESAAVPTESISVVNVAADSQEAESKMTVNDLGEIGKPKDLPVLFSIEAGAGYLAGWKNPDGRDANGFNLVIGVNHFRHLTSKIAFSYGIQYTSTGNMSYSNHVTKVTRLKLGEESTVTVFTPVKAHYVVAPLRFSYNIDPMNTFGVGCNVAYLLTVESEVETFDQRFKVKGESVITKELGYTEGFKEFDAQASVFYKRRLYPNLSVNTEFFYGLTDVKDNTFFNLNAFERNTGIKLTLVYNILKKN
jgi:hypothetical protein